jgi:hypothetical protein
MSAHAIIAHAPAAIVIHNQRMRFARYHGPPRRATGGARWGWLGVLLLVAGACGGGGRYNGGVYDDGTVRYRVAAPLGWERVAVGDNDLSFHHADLGTISINSTCRGYEDLPAQALMNELLFGTRERFYRTEDVVTVDGRGALHNVIDLELDGVPLTLEVYLVTKDGCVYDITRVSSREGFEPGRAALTAFVRSFQVLAPRVKV